MRRTRPKIAISENVTTGNINQRIVEVLQHDMDARESCKHLLVRFAVLCHGMPWGSDQALDVGNVNVKLYKIYIYIYACFPSQVIFTEPADVGFSCIARKRAFQIFVDRTKGRFVANPAEIYQALCDGLGSRHLTIGHLMDFASSEDLKLELGLQGKSMDSYPGNLLSSFETKNKDEYERILSNKYSDGIPADQVYCLGQNPLKVPKLSNGGVMPAFTKTDKLLWHHGLKRHVLAIEKFAAHGIGVTADLAKLLGTPAT